MMGPRRIDDSTLRGQLPVAVLAGLIVVASAAMLAVEGIQGARIAAAFAVLIAVGEVVRITLPGDREAAPLAAAGALAYALLPGFDGEPMTYGVPQAVVVVSVGTALGAIPYLAAGRSMRIDEFTRRVIVTAVVAALFRPLLDREWNSVAVLALTMSAIAVVGFTVDTLLAAVMRSARDRAPFARTLIDEARAVIGIGSAITATGVLIALAGDVMAWWALVVFAIPLLLTQFSFRRYASIRATYLQTIRSLARVTEVGGYTETGHARRVAHLSLMIGREMGLSERELMDLEYAALMHDIGQLSLQEPIAGGATTMVSPQEQRRIAGMGAAVIRQTASLARVADIVEHQADWVRPMVPTDDEVPLGSRIISVCNAYDDLVGSGLESDRRLQALERLRLSSSQVYDARVVDVLSRIVGRDLAYSM
ncbi:MAG: HD domain-containing phosphohydrolase [Actinomycetes bacterium]